MKVLIGIDSSSASHQVLDEAVARPWSEGTIFCVAQLFAQTLTLRIRQMDGLKLSTDKLDLAAPGRGDLTTA
jgi:hypothetical protein